MHCNICDKDMSDKETNYNEDMKAYEPCTTCLDIAMDAAYCDGFKTENDEYELVVESSFDDYSLTSWISGASTHVNDD